MTRRRLASLYVTAWHAWATTTSAIEPELVLAVAEACNWASFSRFTLAEIAKRAGISVDAARSGLLQLEDQGFVAVCVPAHCPEDEATYRLDLAPSKFVAEYSEQPPATSREHRTRANSPKVASFWAALPPALTAGRPAHEVTTHVTGTEPTTRKERGQ